MSLVTIETIWIDRVTMIIGAVHNFGILYLLVHQLQTRRHSKKPMPKHAKFMNSWAVLSVLFNAGYCALRVPVSFGVFTTSCSLQSSVLCTLWTLGKLCVYMFFTSRLDVAFRYSSSFRMSRSWFFFLYGTICSGWMTQMVLVGIFWRGTFIDLYGTQFCATSAPYWMYWGGLAAWDFFISTLLCYLFISRLFQAQSRRSSVSQKDGNNFMRTIAQYVTITVVGVISTLVSFALVGMTSWVSLVAIDTIINSWCVFLMYGRNKHLFHKLCGCCHICMQYCCVTCVTLRRGYLRQKRKWRHKRRKRTGPKTSTKSASNANNPKNAKNTQNDDGAMDLGDIGDMPGAVTVKKLSVASASPASPTNGVGSDLSAMDSSDPNDANHERLDTLHSQSSLTGLFPDFKEIFRFQDDMQNEASGMDDRQNDSTRGSAGTAYETDPELSAIAATANKSKQGKEKVHVPQNSTNFPGYDPNIINFENSSVLEQNGINVMNSRQQVVMMESGNNSDASREVTPAPKDDDKEKQEPSSRIENSEIASIGNDGKKISDAAASTGDVNDDDWDHGRDDLGRIAELHG